MGAGGGAGPVGLITGGVQAMAGFGFAKLQERGIKQEAEFAANQMRFNAKLAELNAEDAERRGEKLADKIARQKRQTIATQRVGAVAQGIAIDQDDIAALQMDVEMFAALDELQARENAAMQARGYRMDAALARAQADFTQATGKRQAAMTVIGSGISGLGNIASGLESDINNKRITSDASESSKTKLGKGSAT